MTKALDKNAGFGIFIMHVIASVLLIYAIGDRSAGYYDFLRLYIVFFIGIGGTGLAVEMNKYVLAVITVIIAIVFNPFAPPGFVKSTWQFLDAVCSVYLLGQGLFLWKTSRLVKESS